VSGDAWACLLVCLPPPKQERDGLPLEFTVIESTYRFRVALSFPGEYREFVEEIARLLGQDFGEHRVLYDRFHEAEFARPNLDTHLQSLYHDQSELVVVFLCAHYERKEWPGLEWRAIRDLIKRKQAASLMLIRFDDATVPGVFSIDGYISVQDRPASEIASLIKDRLKTLETERQSLSAAHSLDQPIVEDVFRASLLHEKPKVLRRNVDVGIIIALKEEFRELYVQLPNNCQFTQDGETGCLFYTFERGGSNRQRPYLCVATLAGQMGHTRSALVTETLIRLWNPQTIVNIGIAAGISTDVLLGDVVVATQVDSYLERSKAVPEPRKLTPKTKNFTFDLSGEVYRASSDLVRTVQNLEFAHNTTYQKWQRCCKEKSAVLLPVEEQSKLLRSRFMGSNATCHEGHLASGPTVGASIGFIQWLKQRRDRSYLGLEMEAGGVLQAVYERADPKHSLILRGVSDFGDNRKKKLDSLKDGAMRRYAMHNATQLLWSLLESGTLPQSKAVEPLKHLKHVKTIYPLSSDSRRTHITFYDHIRVNRRAVRDALMRSTDVNPEIEWHPKIIKALRLIEAMHHQIDEKICLFPWYKNYPETRKSNVLTLKMEFFDAYERLIPIIPEVREQFVRLLESTIPVGIDHRVAAVTTFVTLSALRLVFYVQQFEGRTIDENGRPIIRFFEDLPRVPGTLLRLVPCFSYVGLFAFGEKTYLRARVGPSANSYERIILPQILAEHLQTKAVRNDADTYYRWVLPQWLVKTNEPPHRPDDWLVSVVSDELGQEKYMSWDTAPWRDVELEDCDQNEASKIYGDSN
jgi:nucleoside phosphorylase